MRDYYNQAYHNMLDWRLGLDLAHVAADKDFVPSIMEKDGYWYSFLKGRIEAMIKHEKDVISFVEKEESFVLSVRDETVILAHPFWSAQKVLSLRQEYAAPDAKVIFANAFARKPLL